MNIKRAITILTLCGCFGSAGAANFTFNFGAGFNDPTVVAPVGGNTGTTLGQQRQILFQAAADVWGALIDSTVDIVVDAQFTSLDCTPTGATLGSAGAAGNSAVNLMGFLAFYPRSLEDALTGTDNDPMQPDITADFNDRLDDPNPPNDTCLGGATFYYGLDGNNPTGTVLLFPVVLHELAHGLGFASFVDETDGSFPTFENPPGPDIVIPSVFDFFIFDVDDNEFWTDMTNAERFDSITDDPNVVWDGINVTNNAAMFTSTGFNAGSLRLYAPGTFEPGSSISHFTDVAGPTDLLMEPVQGNGGFNQVDVTPFLFQDLGYTITPGGADVIFASSFEEGE